MRKAIIIKKLHEKLKNSTADGYSLKKEAVHVVVQLRKQYKECFKLQWRRAVWADTGGL